MGCVIADQGCRARQALVAHKIPAMQLQAGQPPTKGNKRGGAYAYNIKELRNREIDVARHAEHAYEQFVSRWQPRRGRTGTVMQLALGQRFHASNHIRQPRAYRTRCG
jgi:hypothetical protein